MRIGIDARMLDNTGIGTYLRNLLIHLAPIDRRNEYILFINEDNSRIVDQSNFTCVPFPKYIPLYSIQEQYWLPKVIREWRPDIFHCPNFNVPLIQTVPCIVTIHDLIYYLYPEQCPSKLAHYYAKCMLWYATHSARLVFTDSENSKQDLVKHFRIPAEKIHVILLAANRQCCVPASGQLSEKLRGKYGITSAYIFYSGKHHPYKNIRTLLHAYSIHPEVYEKFQLVIAGKHDSRREALYTTAKALHCGNSIVFTDLVPEEELFELYQHARLFVFPSLYEGFGLPPLEAMACGVPVITSNAASLPEVAGDAAIQVDPLDIQALADAMRAVLTDQGLWENMKQKGLRRSQFFSWDTAATQLLQIYESFNNLKLET
jgi:glycosyltransferase involved in cell wall biosynthesis